MLNVTRGVGRSGSAILILTGLMAVPAAAVEVRVPVPQVHITVAPPPVHTLTPQLHTVTPTVKGNVLNAVKGLQQNTLKGGGMTGGANISGRRDSSSNSTTVRAATLKTVVGSKSTTATGGATLDVTGTHSSAPPEKTFDPVYQNYSRASGASPNFFSGAGSVASFSFNKIDPTGKASVVSLIQRANPGAYIPGIAVYGAKAVNSSSTTLGPTGLSALDPDSAIALVLGEATSDGSAALQKAAQQLQQNVDMSGALRNLSIRATAAKERSSMGAQNSDMSSQDQLTLQNSVQEKSEAEQVFSNAMKQEQKTQAGVIKNMK